MLHERHPQTLEYLLGYVSDPLPEILFNKDLLAQITIRKLELRIQILENQLELSKMAHEMLLKEYR